MKSAENFTPYPAGSLRELWHVAFPLILTALSGNLMMFFDRVILANYSTEAMNSATVAGNVCFVFIVGICGIAGIAEVFVGQYNGARKYHKLGEPVWQMIWLSLATYIIFIPLTLYSGPYLLPSVDFDLAHTYYRWLLAVSPIFAVAVSICAFFIGKGQAMLITVVALCTNVVNIVLDIVLVFGLDGIIPSLGIKGAAIATVIAEIFNITVLLIAFLSRNNIKNHSTNNISFNPKLMMQCIKIGGPLSISHMVELSAWALTANILSRVSEMHITVFAIGQSIFMLIAFITDGMQKAVTAVASNLIGAKKIYLIPMLLRSGMKLLLILSAIIFVLLFFFNDYILQSFVGNKIDEAADLHRIMLITIIWMFAFFVVDIIVWIFVGILTAAGDTKFTMMVNSLTSWIFCVIPVYYLFVYNSYAPEYVWLPPVGYASLCMLIFYFRYKSDTWKNKVQLAN